MPEGLFIRLLYPGAGDPKPIEIEEGIIYINVVVNPELEEVTEMLDSYHQQIEAQLANSLVMASAA